MAFDLNRFVATGRLVDNPELRYTRSGVAMARFILAIARPGRTSEDNESGSDALFLPVTAWRGVAENTAQFSRKGDRVAVDGALVENGWRYSESGEEMRRIELNADRVVFLSKARKSEQSAGPDKGKQSEEVPF